MNIITELLRYIIIIIIGIVLSNWYKRKKGWEHQFKTSLFFILCWRTGVFLIVITMNLMLDLFLLDSFLITFYYFVIHPIILLIITFILNIILGMEFFKLLYHQKTQEFTVIILIIVIIDMILESLFFYIILIPETIVANFNL